MNFEELIKILELLNPNVEIRVGNPSKDPEAFTRIFSSVAGSELKLPEGFKYDNNGINNRHHTYNGTSIMIDVELLTTEVESILLPKGMKVVRNERPTPESGKKVSQVARSAIARLYDKVIKKRGKGI